MSPSRSRRCCMNSLNRSSGGIEPHGCARNAEPAEGVSGGGSKGKPPDPKPQTRIARVTAGGRPRQPRRHLERYPHCVRIGRSGTPRFHRRQPSRRQGHPLRTSRWPHATLWSVRSLKSRPRRAGDAPWRRRLRAHAGTAPWRHEVTATSVASRRPEAARSVRACAATVVTRQPARPRARLRACVRRRRRPPCLPADFSVVAAGQPLHGGEPPVSRPIAAGLPPRTSSSGSGFFCGIMLPTR
jgi:hypothetical protein